MGEPGLTGPHGYNGRPGLRGPKGQEGDAGLGTNIIAFFMDIKIIKMFFFQVVDGVYGPKGEAGSPGRFGYDGFPGNENLRINFTKLESNVIFESNRQA